MAKTLKTGDVARVEKPTTLFPMDKWVLINKKNNRAVWASLTRESIRELKSSAHRIAKIIRRTPKYVFVEVSK